MYKTLYQLDLYTKENADPTELGPDVSAIALNQIKAGRDIDVQVTSDGVTFNIIEPYHSIEYVIVESTRQQVEDPVDDNCIVDGDDDTGILTLISADGIDIPQFRAILASEALDGQYGPLTFSSEAPEEMGSFPDGYLSYAWLPIMEINESLTVPGLPVGMTVWAPLNEEEPGIATVHGTLVVETGR